MGALFICDTLLMPAFFFLFGLIIGSFLNVVVLRRGVSTLGGRSHCMSCGHQLFWYDTVPLLSYALLGGRCRYCRARISPQYPLVELFTGLSFALLASAHTPLSTTLLGCALVVLLIMIALYDVRHTIIPDAWVAAFCVLALVYGSLYSQTQILFAILSGPLIALPLFLLWLVSEGRWMGLGDAKLALGIGWLLGPLYGYFALTAAFILGAFISIATLLPLPKYRALLSKWGLQRTLSSQSFTMKSEVPFGPFLIAGTLILWTMLLFHLQLPL